MITKLNVRPETIKLQEENTGSTLFDISLSNVFLVVSSQTRKTKAKINKRGHIRLKNFCITKETNNKMKRQPTEWEKIFANDISIKGLISKIYKELTQLNIFKKQKIQLKNGQKH